MASCGTITVRAGFDASAVAVSECPDLTPAVDPGATATASFNTRNDNDAPASLTVEVVVDGQRVRTATVSVAAGATRSLKTVQFTAPSEAGDHNVEVNKLSAAQARTALASLPTLGDADRRTLAVGGAGLGTAALASLLL